MAVFNMLEYIRKTDLQIKQFLFTSSAAVYGNLPELPKKEDSRVEPLSPYAIDKYSTERFVLAYGDLYNLPTVCVRFSMFMDQDKIQVLRIQEYFQF